MEDKMITVEICSGTACYVQGGSFLFDIEEQLSEEEKDRIQINGAACLGFCTTGSEYAPPFATVNGNMLSRTTVDSLLNEIRRQLGGMT